MGKRKSINQRMPKMMGVLSMWMEAQGKERL
jgi:hypothetical protein